MKKWVAAATLLLSTALAGCSHPQPVYYQPPSPPPPPAFYEIARQRTTTDSKPHGTMFADGTPLIVERHERFHNPPVPPEAYRDYRDGFRRGYIAFINRMPASRPGY
jgi:hypothetical protein